MEYSGKSQKPTLLSTVVKETLNYVNNIASDSAKYVATGAAAIGLVASPIMAQYAISNPGSTRLKTKQKIECGPGVTSVEATLEGGEKVDLLCPTSTAKPAVKPANNKSNDPLYNGKACKDAFWGRGDCVTNAVARKAGYNQFKKNLCLGQPSKVRCYDTHQKSRRKGGSIADFLNRVANNQCSAEAAELDKKEKAVYLAQTAVKKAETDITNFLGSQGKTVSRHLSPFDFVNNGNGANAGNKDIVTELMKNKQTANAAYSTALTTYKSAVKRIATQGCGARGLPLATGATATNVGANAVPLPNGATRSGAVPLPNGATQSGAVPLPDGSTPDSGLIADRKNLVTLALRGIYGKGNFMGDLDGSINAPFGTNGWIGGYANLTHPQLGKLTLRDQRPPGQVGVLEKQVTDETTFTRTAGAGVQVAYDVTSWLRVFGRLGASMVDEQRNKIVTINGETQQPITGEESELTGEASAGISAGKKVRAVLQARANGKTGTAVIGGIEIDF